MKNLEILICESFFLNLAFLKKVRQSISHNIIFFLTIVDLKIVLREFLGLVDLIRAYTLYIYELREVIMVNRDEDLVFAAFQVRG